MSKPRTQAHVRGPEIENDQRYHKRQILQALEGGAMEIETLHTDVCGDFDERRLLALAELIETGEVEVRIGSTGDRVARLATEVSES